MKLAFYLGLTGFCSKMSQVFRTRSQTALNEPIYSEPLPMPVRCTTDATGAEGGGDHIYEFLTKKRMPPSLPLPPPPTNEPPPKIRNSLSTSPSTEEEGSQQNTGERKRCEGKTPFLRILLLLLILSNETIPPPPIIAQFAWARSDTTRYHILPPFGNQQCTQLGYFHLVR